MKKLILAISLTLIILIFVICWVLFHPSVSSPKSGDRIRQRNLSKYKFEVLAQKKFAGSKIENSKLLSENKKYSSHVFRFTNDEGKKISGLLDLPKGKSHLPWPVVVLIRGYVDREIYSTGVGTKNAAAFFANHGFVAISPDFLGYGDSDAEPSDILESRFEKPFTALSLLASIQNFPQIDTGANSIILDPSRIYIWSHSNGGQIALSVLEITGENIPTSLWAPVSIGFPESILNFIDELPDKGEYIKNDLKDFASRYDFSPYSIANFWDKIHASIQLHQGGADTSVPKDWSDKLANKLGLKYNASYFYYPKSDHNMRPDWQTAIERDLKFFQNHH